MRERVLRDFFENKATIAELARDVAGSISQRGPKISVVSIEDMDGEFTVAAPMLVRLCDVVLGGELEADALHSIGFALTRSEPYPSKPPLRAGGNIISVTEKKRLGR